MYRGLDRGEKMIFLITAFGKPFTPAGFGNAMRDWCDPGQPAPLPRARLAEGLRQRHSRKPVPHRRDRIRTGHQSLEEIERHTRAAGKKPLAEAAMAKLK